jgi:hypothetical protein
MVAVHPPTQKQGGVVEYKTPPPRLGAFPVRGKLPVKVDLNDEPASAGFLLETALLESQEGLTSQAHKVASEIIGLVNYARVEGSYHQGNYFERVRAINAARDRANKARTLRHELQKRGEQAAVGQLAHALRQLKLVEAS